MTKSEHLPPSALKRPKTVSIISLGCPKNLVDSESMLGRLAAAGYAFANLPTLPTLENSVEDHSPRTDLVLLNTCGFLESARCEAFAEIARLLEAKRAGSIGQIAVCGCLIPAVGASLREKFPEVDFWFGPFDEPRLVPIVSQAPSEPPFDHVFYHTPKKRLEFFDDERFRLTVPHTAYLKIADGCDRFCSYCAIPNIRGRFVSKPLAVILDEARRLADSGVRELVLIAQETTFWGADSDGTPRLAELLAKLRCVGGFDGIRVLYAYPLFMGDDLLEQFGFEKAGAGESPILPYIDLPLQHASDRILRAMNRRVDRAQTEELLARLREKIRDLVLRTTFIVGFPGETEAEFAELVAFVKKWRFERAGVFEFSPEPGTAAAQLDGRVPAEISRRRFRKLETVTKKCAERFARSRIGTKTDVLIDEPICDEQGNPLSDFWLGRSWTDSPDIDPRVFVTGEGFAPGDKVPCEIVAAEGSDLVAVPF